LDIRYTRQADVDRLRERAEQMAALGCTQFALLFDDIPDRMDPADIARFGSLAAAQCAVANAFYQWTREHEPQAALFFCPTPYCGRMASRSLGGEGYLEEIGRGLSSGIDIFWTGPDIISRGIISTRTTTMAADSTAVRIAAGHWNFGMKCADC
jgi:hypothetical protein